MAQVNIRTLTANLKDAQARFPSAVRKTEEALSLRNLTNQQKDISTALGKQIDQAVREGVVDSTKGAELRKKLQEAAKPIMRKQPIAAGFGGTVVETEEIDQEATAKWTYQIQREINRTLRDARTARNEVEKVSELALSDETQAKMRASEVEILIARKQVELAEVRAEAAKPDSRQSVSETIAKEQRIQEEIFQARRNHILTEYAEQSRFVREKTAGDARFSGLKDAAQRELAIRQEIADRTASLEADKNQKLALLDADHAKQRLEGQQELSAAILDAQKRSEQTRLEFARLTNDELLADEIETTQKIRELHEAQRNLSPSQRLSDADLARAEALIRQGQALQRNEIVTRRTLELERDRNDAALSLASASQSNDQVRNHARLQELLTAQNALLYEEIRLNEQAISSGTLALDQRNERLRKNVDLQAQEAWCNLKSDPGTAMGTKVALARARATQASPQLRLAPHCPYSFTSLKESRSNHASPRGLLNSQTRTTSDWSPAR
jgi:hypothetical protein